MRLSRGQFEALFEGLGWRRMWSRRVRRPKTVQWQAALQGLRPPILPL